MTDFPMFEWDEDESAGRPSTIRSRARRPSGRSRFARRSGHGARARVRPDRATGTSSAAGRSGSTSPSSRRRCSTLLALTPEEQRAKFGFLLDALAMGAPPHGGIAFGIDRMTMVLAGEPNLRDVIAFPKNQAGVDPMSGAPRDVTRAQLAELGARGRRAARSRAEPARSHSGCSSLAAVALLAGSSRSRSSSGETRRRCAAPQAGDVAAGGGWYDALARRGRPAGTPSERRAG